jgi:pentatricopeptide repeat protein
MSAKAGRHDKALEYLSHVVDSGFRPSEWIAADPDLKSLHGDPRFDALVAKARQTAAR